MVMAIVIVMVDSDDGCGVGMTVPLLVMVNMSTHPTMRMPTAQGKCNRFGV